MPRIIEDAFTHLNVSRQRRYQLRMEAAGRCRICGVKAEQKGAPYCEKHRKQQSEYDKERREEHRPHKPDPQTTHPQLSLFPETDADKI